jgi:hypothetical protein
MHDSGHFTAVQGILQAVAEEDGEREGFAKLVGSRGGAGGLNDLQYSTLPTSDSNHAHRCRTACQASMSSEQRAFSNVSLVHGPEESKSQYCRGRSIRRHPSQSIHPPNLNPSQHHSRRFPMQPYTTAKGTYHVGWALSSSLATLNLLRP